jgi:hypothetical protein
VGYFSFWDYASIGAMAISVLLGAFVLGLGIRWAANGFLSSMPDHHRDFCVRTKIERCVHQVRWAFWKFKWWLVTDDWRDGDHPAYNIRRWLILGYVKRLVVGLAVIFVMIALGLVLKFALPGYFGPL